MFTPKRILVPTDFSDNAAIALKNAIDIARQYDAKVYLLHVIDQVLYQCLVDYCISDAVMQQIEKESLKIATEKLRQEVTRISDADSRVEISFDVRQGTPYYEIMKEQEEKKIDLIVIASHGKAGMPNNSIGSVAETVLKGAKGHVLLIKN